MKFMPDFVSFTKETTTLNILFSFYRDKEKSVN